MARLRSIKRCQGDPLQLPDAATFDFLTGLITERGGGKQNREIARCFDGNLPGLSFKC